MGEQVPVWSGRIWDEDAERVRAPRVERVQEAVYHQEANPVEVRVVSMVVVEKAADAEVDSDQPLPGIDVHHGC